MMVLSIRISVGQDRDPDPFENDPIRKNKNGSSIRDPWIEITKVSLILIHGSRSCSPLIQNTLQRDSHFFVTI